MISKLLAFVTILIAGGAIGTAYTQQSAFYLRQDNQSNYWPRHGTRLSGRYRSGIWVANPTRQSYGQFQGGGPGSGK